MRRPRRRDLAARRSRRHRHAHGGPRRETVADVTVVDRAELDRSAGQSLVEILARQPGLQFSGSGGLGKTDSLFIRGHETRHTVLLIDGVRVGSATSGTPSLDNLPLDSIERIEIVRGPLSSLYGSDAVGGVVQVFTRRGREGLRPNLRATVGSNHFGQIGGGVSFGDGRFDGAVQVQTLDTRGFSATNSSVPFGNFNPDRDGFQQNGASVRLGGKLTDQWRIEGLALESDGTTALRRRTGRGCAGQGRAPPCSRCRPPDA